MKSVQYKTFSKRRHTKNFQLNRPSLCQFELTFRCALHCKHCYTDCYNQPSYAKQELSTQEVKCILDKIFRAGTIWLCLTGGDPLAREDFPDIYAYAKRKGFIMMIFTNAYSLTQEIVHLLQKSPPFVIEITVNAVTKNVYERISRVPGSFAKAMQGIKLIQKANLPLKVKTQVTKDNFKQLSKIKRFVNNLGLAFRPSSDLFARLNHDLTPCNLRVSPVELTRLQGKQQTLQANDCQLSEKRVLQNKNSDSYLFPCVAGAGDGIYVDPYGDTFVCNLIRKPRLNLLKVDVEQARAKLLPLIRQMRFVSDSKCKTCNIRSICYSCPGRAYLENHDWEAPIEYYCTLARLGR